MVSAARAARRGEKPTKPLAAISSVTRSNSSRRRASLAAIGRPPVACPPRQAKRLDAQRAARFLAAACGRPSGSLRKAGHRSCSA